MSVEEYSLNFTMFYKYAPSLVSNPRDEMRRFLTGVADLVKGECRTTMLHGDMNLSRLMVYAQSIEDSKLNKVSRNLKRSGPSEQNQPRSQIQNEPRDPKVKIEKGSGSQDGKPTCATCGKKHYGKCLVGDGNCFGCGKDGHKVRDCPTIAARGKEGKKVHPSVPDDDVSRRNRFYSL
ncbi:uncharacterized protein [Solanum lycopersicum]|uniref:uncharacterized protein n=1 Tax=Solanum lycopersicum TaxID=4081 RepID=UPI00374A7084